MSRVAVVTGANRGIGRAVAEGLAARGMAVVVCAREEHAAQIVVDAIAANGGEAVATRLDVTLQHEVDALRRLVEDRFGRWDVLVNNAGMIPDRDGHNTLMTADPDDLERGYRTNTVAPLRLIQAAAPMMETGGYGRIVNVSTGMAGLAEMGGEYVGYRLSKVALNGLTRICHAELSAFIKVNSVCPGWVRTDMGGPSATRAIPEGAASVIWAATLPDDGPSGGFFRDGELLAW
jgi:NAD(P)-dependent dehydrogenase (short-subunit alcohol dehydrogenase family)